MIPNLVPNQKTKKNTVRLIMQTNLLKWEVDMFIHITLKQILWSSVTTTTWKPCSRLLVQNKFLPITNLFLAADVDSFSCLPILVQLPPFPVLEDGLTTNGSVTWSSTMNSCLPSTLAISKSVTSHSCLDPSSLSSPMFTLAMRHNSCALNGLMLLKSTRHFIWAIQSNKWSMFVLIKSTISSRSELL